MLQEANRHLQHIQFSEGPQLTAATITELVRGAANASGRLTRQRICSVLSTVRKRANLPEDSTLVLLTETGSDGDWLNMAEGNNHYVWSGTLNPSLEHASQVEILYLLANNLLGAGMYDGFEELVRQMHTKLRGCILDRCADHEDLSVKIRTADACPKCMAQIRSRIDAGKLSAEVVDDCFRLMDAVRTKALHRGNGGLRTQPCNLEIHGYNQDLHLRGKRVPLSPIRRALYQHFLLHPEGVRLYDLSEPHHLQSITRLYQRIATAGTPRYQASTIRKLVENEDGRLNQHLSVIRRTLTGAVGPRDSELYVIRGERGKEFRIPLSKDNIDWTDQRGNPVVIGHRKAM